MLKKVIQATLQRLLGFDTYLYLFSFFIIHTIKWNKREGDINFFLQMLSPTDTVLDIGANIGIMSVLIAKRVKKGRVLAFEPIPDNVKALKRIATSGKHHNITIFELALGNTRQELEMRMPVIKGVKMQGLTHVHHDKVPNYNSPYRDYKVQQDCLDNVLPTEKVQAIKMDVENYEQFVLEGAKDLIKRCKPVIYTELWDNINRDRCFELLTNMGYTPKVLVGGELVVFDKTLHSHQNFFFISAK